MGAKTAIPYVDATWNPVSGCTKISPGCQHCFAERETLRWKRGPFDTIHIHESRLGEPGTWRKSKKILLPSMGDLYHPLVPTYYRDQVFDVMAAEERHTFFLLTKRPGLMVHHVEQRQMSKRDTGFPKEVWPQNVWPGVSVESQDWACRIDALANLRGIAPVLWVSYEPALGAVDFSPYLYCESCGGEGGYRISIEPDEDAEWTPCPDCDGKGRFVDLIVASGESGPEARPSHPDWFRKTRDDCVKARVPFFFKGWGGWGPWEPFAGGDLGGDMRRGIVDQVNGDGREHDGHFRRGDCYMRRVGHRAAGALLDGREWRELPI